ncbi:hypothetical protein [Nocardioides sp. TF02-7]|uniref:hypothetical protein n=1 Tax=Nocardioides sp. TF02-7 TaxID=2917724 RepID=UPI001F06090B|nr:hypothetical protein [Nocardioides sp. TF02-7]UMG93918.1 hypothetical protein MF408_07360 [Nocardioides sp. TF02-7]
MSQVIPEKPLRVVVWATGTVGRHAIAGVDAHPDLELVGVWTSTADKHGKDAGELAGLGRELGVTATTDRDELVALRPDCVVHTAMTDDRVFEAIDDLTGLVRDGVNVVSSGPVILLHPDGTLPPEMVADIHAAGRGGRCQPARQRHRPRLRQRRAAARPHQPQPAHRPRAGQRDRRLLHLRPAGRDARAVRLRAAARRHGRALGARDPEHGVGAGGPADRRRARRHPRRAARRGGRTTAGRARHQHRLGRHP